MTARARPVRRPGRRARRTVVLVLAGVSALGLRAWERGAPRPHRRAPPAAGILATGRDPLRAARAAKRAVRGLSAADASEARARAARAYQTAAEGLRGAGRAEALFRAGELARVAGDARLARDCFERAAEPRPRSTYTARARLELAHLDRRGGRDEAAIARYEAIAADGRVEREVRDAALRWCATVCEALGREAEAQRRWRVLAAHARSPLDRARAHDRLGLALLASGDTPAARRLLQDCERALAPVAEELTRTGAAVRAALQRMRLRARLAEIDGG